MSAKVRCDQCNQQFFCTPCDDMFHRHPKRNTHIRKAIVFQSNIKPPLPPKGETTLPVAPPRRNKKSILMPLLGRKEPVRNNLQSLPQRPPPPPSPSLSLRERVNSLKRMIVPNNKPETPKQKEGECFDQFLIYFFFSFMVK